MLLAREAVNLDRSRQTAGTLLATLLRNPSALGTFSSPITDRPQAISVSPDGRTLAVVENSGLARFYDTRTRRERHDPLANAAHLPPVHTRDGAHVLLLRSPSPDEPPAVDVVDARTLRHVRYLPLDKRWLSTPTSFQNPLLVSPDGRTAYMAYAVVDPATQSNGPAFVDRWDMRSGKLLDTAALDSTGLFDARIAADGKLVVLTDTELLTLDGRTLRRVGAKRVNMPVTSTEGLAAVSPDGNVIAVASREGAVSFLDVRTGRTAVGAGKTGVANQAIAFSPTGDVAVTSDDDGNVVVWNPKNADVVSRFTGHENRVLGIAFSADGKLLYTSSLDGAIFEWDLGGGRRFGRPFVTMPNDGAPPDEQDVSLLPPLAVSGDSSRFAARIGAQEIGLFSLATLRRTRAFTADVGGKVSAVAWSPVGDRLAVAGKEGRVQLWDVRGRRAS